MKKNIILLLLLMAHVAVSAAALKPSMPTGLKIAVWEMDSTTFAWELPDSYTDGTPFPEGVEVSQVKIFRNLEEIALLDGPVTEFTDHYRWADYPGGYDIGLLIYEVSVKVGDEWSEPCIPYQYIYGAPPYYYEQIPFEIQCKELTDSEVEYTWSRDSRIWENKAEGMTYTADASVENRDLIFFVPILFEHRHDYVLEYQISSSDNTEYEIAIYDGMDDPEYFDLKLLQEIVTDAVATDDNTVKKVEFTYRFKVYQNGSYRYLSTSPTIVLRPLRGNNLVLSSMRIYESETTTVTDVFKESDVRDVRFYDLQGRSVGAEPDGLTPGIYIRQRTDSHGNIRCDKLLVR